MLRRAWHSISVAGSNARRCVGLRSALVTCFVLALPLVCHSIVIGTRGIVDAKGNNITCDSFDSTDPNYSTNGLYYAPRRRAGGDIVANGGFTNSIVSIGNMKIAGHIFTPSPVSVAIGPSGSVGDLSWVTNKTGIKPGWWRNDVYVDYPDIVLPPAPWQVVGPGTPSGMGGPGTVDGTAYDHVFTISGWYQVNDSGTIYVGTNAWYASVKILATTSNFQPQSIYVAGTGDSAGQVWIYLAGASATIRTTHLSQSGRAEKLRFYGLPSCTALTYSGNGDFAGLIYAPSANFNLAGGGSGSMNFVGVFVTKTLSVNGHYDFHVDESLGGYLPVAAILTSAVSTNGGFQLGVEGAGGVKYAVQCSSNLTDWTATVTNRSPFIFVDTNAVSNAQLFYRAVSMP